MSEREVVGFDTEEAWVHVAHEDGVIAIRVSKEILKNLSLGGIIDVPDDMAEWRARGLLEWRFP